MFGSDVVDRQLQPVFQFGGAKIGFNPQDRFMMTLGNTIVVVTADGSAFGCDIIGSGPQRQLAPVLQFSGARIGFNPQDRFMMTLGSTLVVVTADGSVWGSEEKSTRTNTVHRHQCRWHAHGDRSPQGSSSLCCSSAGPRSGSTRRTGS